MSGAEASPSAWSKRSSLLFYTLGGVALASSFGYVYGLMRYDWPSGPLLGGFGAVVVFLWMLTLREFIRSYGSYSRSYHDTAGSQIAESAKEALAKFGFELVEDEKSQSIGATIYRLRWSRERSWVRAEIWAHGRRANVKVKFAVEQRSEWGRILGAFEPTPGTVGRPE